MATRRAGSRAFRPDPLMLETRRVLSAVVRGVDVDGDTWVLRLIGPGDLRVENQPDADDNFVPVGEPGLISQITIGGTLPLASRLEGRVQQASGGDGKVFFENLTHVGARGVSTPGPAGITTIDMPDFWLGHTSTQAPTPGADAGTIAIPQGIITLRFGGVDANFTPEGGTPLSQNGQNDPFRVNLGLPRSWGTSIIVDRIITNAQAATTSTGSPTQDSVTFNVRGRINLFQADAIEGNAAFPSSGFTNGGGTIVRSIPDATTDNPEGTGVTGQIGFVRVGNNATNFSVQTNDLISNYYVGGETNNVQILAPTGLRNAYFGKGMDTATIYTNELNTLQANRGALNSTVYAGFRAGQIIIGGDVSNTLFLAGYQVNPNVIFVSQTPPDLIPVVRDEGAIGRVLIAGDVIDSVFAASVDPTGGFFGAPDSLEFPHGKITAKVEGSINNENETPDQPDQAFYAKNVFLKHGPVAPPNVVEAPFPHPGLPPSGPRLGKDLQPTIRRRASAG
jgi:hypothetical protein